MGGDGTRSTAAGGTARQRSGCRFRPGWRRQQLAIPSVTDVLAGQQAIFETRRQVFQSQATVNREKRSQVEKEIEGLRAQEGAAARRIEIVREEVAIVAMLVEQGT